MSNNFNANKTHCSKGHEYTEENTRLAKNSNGNVSRKCRACEKAIKREYYLNVRRALVVKDLSYEEVKDRTLHTTWAKMKGRCYNKNSPDYPAYGARGIKVCERWQKYNNFFDDMIEGYQKGLTIDRINNDGDYEPDNCRWATPKEQANNTRKNHMITFRGQTKTLQQWSETVGIKSATIRYRLRMGYNPEVALTAPVGRIS